MQVVIHTPSASVKDALVLYHPTVWFDDRTLPAAESTLDNFKRLLQRDDMLLVSVAHPQQDREIDEGLREVEAALLWVKQECGLMAARHGSASANPAPYRRISLLSFTAGFKADALFMSFEAREAFNRSIDQRRSRWRGARSTCRFCTITTDSAVDRRRRRMRTCAGRWPSHRLALGTTRCYRADLVLDAVRSHDRQVLHLAYG